MNGNENVMSSLKEITGAVSIAVVVQLRFITNDTQEEISEKNQLNGSFPFANHVMTPDIADIL
jgi:hypothetical protein